MVSSRLEKIAPKWCVASGCGNVHNQFVCYLLITASYVNPYDIIRITHSIVYLSHRGYTTYALHIFKWEMAIMLNSSQILRAGLKIRIQIALRILFIIVIAGKCAIRGIVPIGIMSSDSSRSRTP